MLAMLCGDTLPLAVVVLLVHAYEQSVDNLTIVEDGAEDLVLSGGGGLSPGVERVVGVRTSSGNVIEAPAVVLTTGTFLRGVVHLGLEKYPAGRHKRDRCGRNWPRRCRSCAVHPALRVWWFTLSPRRLPW